MKFRRCLSILSAKPHLTTPHVYVNVITEFITLAFFSLPGRVDMFISRHISSYEAINTHWIRNNFC